MTEPENEPGIDLDAFWEYARSTGDFDDEFLDRMDRARAEDKLAAEVSKRRPTLDQLGRLLSTHLDVVDAALSLERLKVLAELERQGDLPDFVDDGAWWPAVGSPAFDDLKLLASTGWPSSLLRDEDHDDYGRVVRTARRLVEAVIDHLRAIAILAQDGRTVRPPLALTRVAIDAAAHMHHVSDPGVDAANRLIRALNEDLVVLSEAVRDAERAGTDRPTEEEKAIDALLTEVKRIRPAMHASWPAKDRPNGSKLGRVPFIDKFVGTASMIDAALDVTAGQLWADLSAVVHNQESNAFRLMFALELSKNARERAKNISSRVLTALFVLDQALRGVGPYMGWNLEPLYNADLLNIWAIGGGLADHLIREQILSDESDS